MTTEYSGGGDPKRSIELMWGVQEQRPRRGPKPRLTVDRIAAAAIELADEEGLPALSMRRVAERLGVTAMSLYTYVPSKAELIDVMLDRVCAEPARPEDLPGGWRARLEQVARENWALYRRHPWLLQVATSRPALGPNLVAKYDYELRALSDTGLDEIETDLTLSLVLDYVHGAVRGAVQADQVAQRSGMTDEQWWEEYAPLLEQVLDPERYPTAAHIGSVSGAEYAAPSAPERAFEFGLQRVLDGIEVLVRGRSDESGRR